MITLDFLETGRSGKYSGREFNYSYFDMIWYFSIESVLSLSTPLSLKKDKY
jgi:hypothetical protein